jgi:hypothetical protein
MVLGLLLVLPRGLRDDAAQRRRNTEGQHDT